MSSWRIGRTASRNKTDLLRNATEPDVARTASAQQTGQQHASRQAIQASATFSIAAFWAALVPLMAASFVPLHRWPPILNYASWPLTLIPMLGTNSPARHHSSSSSPVWLSNDCSTSKSAGCARGFVRSRCSSPNCVGKRNNYNQVRIVCVTHLYELAHGFHERETSCSCEPHGGCPVKLQGCS